MRIAILEWVTGGGLNDHALPQSLALEGLAMLRCASELFVRSGHQVEICIDARCEKQLLDATWAKLCTVHQVASPASDVVPHLWLETAKSCDLTLVIAPELDNALMLCCEKLSQVSVLLNCNGNFLENCSNKLKTSHLIEQTESQLFHPPTCLLTDFSGKWAKQAVVECEKAGIKFENDVYMLKRIDGAGCEDQKTATFGELRAAQETMTSNLAENLIVQPKLYGTPYSVTLIVSATGDCCISPFVVQQFSDDGQYLGGCVTTTWPTEQLREALFECLSALEKGARGWIGADLLRQENTSGDRDADDRWILLEFNPRMTTSVVGFSDLATPDLGHLLAGTIAFPERFPIAGRTHRFSADGSRQ